MTHSRRHFLRRGAAFSLGFAGLESLLAGPRALAAVRDDVPVGFGPLVPDPAGVLDLPAGFSYSAFSRMGEAMDDGLLVPGQHDGMAAFPGPDGRVLLVRNHELEPTWLARGPFGPRNERLGLVPREMIYDYGRGGMPGLGGTVTLVYNPATRTLERQFLSLAGTEYNCAGGPTPWGTWLTCEETTSRGVEGRERDHGYVFEVTPSSTPGLSPPVALAAMGRFRHEAVAIDPRTDCVYLTEDLADGVLYRFIPSKPGRLREGGRLQALVVIDTPTLDTKNWDQPRVKVGEKRRVRWVDVSNVAAPDDDLRLQAAAKGAALFARSEGMWYGHDSIYFAATTGGKAQLGQIWKYTPSPDEGHPEESRRPATLQLIIEPNDSTVCNNADNLTVAPWGDLIVCEDGPTLNGLFGVTPQGVPYRLAYHRASDAEMAGATFSPDGSVLFVNIQTPGVTLAIHGPWSRRGPAPG